ncbi:MAG TPA: M28 family peptidase, partial [Xanthomonadales bacterium]
MTHWRKSLISTVFLSLMLAFAYRQTLAPEARSGSDLDMAALTRHVAVIAEKPHPIGSTANRQVRDYIIAHFELLGLKTEVQKTMVIYRHPTRPAQKTIIGQVENIIARLPGRSSGHAESAADLVVMSHYDSRPSGPGAGDDASGTAAIMEVARILVSAPTPAHDVVFLITDGEEMGLLGAQGFFRQHPAARNVGLVLNFEARGSYGASFMFETSNGNAWLVDRLIASAPDLLASSLSYEIYRRMPNDTDMSISKGEGIPGLNFAFSAGLIDYHAMTDTVQNLDKNTLAHQANYVLETTRYFANLENWQSAEGDRTYFNLWQGTLVSYSQGLAFFIGISVLVLGVWLFAAAWRAGTIDAGSVGRGLLCMLVIFLMVYSLFDSLLAYLQKADAGMLRITSLGEWPLLAFFTTTLGITLWFGYRLGRGLSKLDIFVPVLVLLLLVPLAGRSSALAFAPPLLLLPLMWMLRAREGKTDLWTAALSLWWLLAALALYFAVNASYLFAWPLASVLLGIFMFRRLSATGSGVRFTVVLAAGLLPLLLLPPVYIVAYLALGLAQPQVLMVICCLSLLLIWPLLRSIGLVAEGKAALLLLAAGILLTLVVVFGRGFDARHPRAEELFYAIDVDQQQGFWVSPDARVGTWIGKFMGDSASAANMSRIMPGYDREVRIKESAPPQFKAATLKIEGDQTNGGMREIRMHLQSAGRGEYINLLFAADAGILTATVNGFPLNVPETAENGHGGLQLPSS